MAVYVFLFDIDGTLIHSGGAGLRALHRAVREELGADELREVPVHGRTDRGIAANLFQAHGLENSEENWRRFLTAYLRILPTSLRECPGRVLPGVERLLRALAARPDVALGLLTGNMPRGAELKLTHYGLYQYFSFGGYGDRHCRRDDVAADALRAAQAHVPWRVEPQRVWVVGDTPHDIRCGRAIGANVLAVFTGDDDRQGLVDAKPDILLEDLCDLERVEALIQCH